MKTSFPVKLVSQEAVIIDGSMIEGWGRDICSEWLVWLFLADAAF